METTFDFLERAGRGHMFTNVDDFEELDSMIPPLALLRSCES
jgi:hypothetical protein